MSATSRTRRRVGRALALALVTFAGLFCRDRGITGPGLPRSARLGVTPELRLARSGPAIRLVAVRATLTPLPGEEPVLDTVATFATGSEELELDLRTVVTDPQQRFVVRLAATDATGDTVYRAIDTVHLSVDGRRPEPVALPMFYAGPDTVVAGVVVAPRDTTFAVGDSVPMRALAMRADQSPVTGARFGFALSDSGVASITPTGWVKATGAVTNVWVFAGTANGAIDSTRISAVVPVAAVRIAPEAATTAAGDTIALGAAALDRNGNVLAGRTIVFTALDTMAAVLPDGRVIARHVGTARIEARHEAFADTATVTITEQPVAAVTVTPDTLRLQRGDSAQATAVLRDRFGNVLARPASWTTSAPATVSVSASGLIHALAAGAPVHVVAARDGRADTVVVIPEARAAVTVAIDGDSLVMLPGETTSLAVLALDANGEPAYDLGVTWSTLDPAVATATAGAENTVTVRAVALGTTQLVARVGTVADTLPVRVRSPLTELRISPRADTLRMDALSDTTRFSAIAFIGGANPQAVAAEWSTSEPTVASIDASGLLTTHAEGTTWLRAHEPQSGLRDSIVLVVDQVVARIAVFPDTATVHGLGLRRRYNAVAYDRRDVTVPVPGFAWSLAGSGVAVLDSVTGPSVDVVAVGNGVTQVQASALGVSGSGTFTVAQRLATIAVTPGTVTLGAGGTALLVAQLRDVNGGTMSTAQVPVSWESENAAVATVDPVSGLVTGVGTGVTNVRATSGGILSNNVRIEVQAMAILLEADTLAVGSRTEASFAVRLTAPAPTEMAIGLDIADTSVARLGSTSVQLWFPRGAQTQLVTVTGGRLGTTTLRAWEAAGTNCDGRCGPAQNPTFRPDTASVTVIAGVQLEARAEVAMGDSAVAQLALQTPAPAGGLRVTFGYDVPGILRVTPDTVVIPAGHLAAEVIVRTLAQGVAKVTPSVVGAPEPPGLPTTLRVGPPMLALYGNDYVSARLTVGLGQHSGTDIVAILRVPSSTALPLTITSVRGLVRAPADAIVPAGQPATGFGVDALATGEDTIVVTAPLYGEARIPVLVTTPHLSVRPDYEADTLYHATGDTTNIEVATGDSLGNDHEQLRALALTFTSSDTTVVKVVDAAPVVDQGWETVRPRIVVVGGGTATLTATADGHVAGTMTLRAASAKLRLGARYDYGDTTRTMAYAAGHAASGAAAPWITHPTYTNATVIFGVTHSNPAVATSDATVTLASGDAVALGGFRVLAPGTDTVIVSAPGFLPDTLVLQVSRTPFALLGARDTVQVAETGSWWVVTRGPGVLLEATTVRVRSGNQAILPLDSTFLVPAGAEQATMGFALAPLEAGTTTLTVSSTNAAFADTTYTVVVQAPKLLIRAGGSLDRLDSLTVGAGLEATSEGAPMVGVRTFSTSGSDVLVTLSTPEAGIVQLPDTLRLLANMNFHQGLRIAGVAPGTARVIASAPGYAPDTLKVIVTPGVLAEVQYGRLPRTTKAGTSTSWSALALADTIESQWTELVGTLKPRAAADTLVLRVTSTDDAVVRSQVGLVTMAPGSSSVPALPIEFGRGGRATLTVADTMGRIRPYAVTVTVEEQRLTFDQWGYQGNRTTLGMRQTYTGGERPVCTNGPLAAPLQVEVRTSDARVASIAPVAMQAGVAVDTVTIPASTYQYGSCAPVLLNGGDTTGTVAVTARAIGTAAWTPDTLRVQVGRPGFRQAASLDALYLGDQGSNAVYFNITDHAGRIRRNLDTLQLNAAPVGTGVLAVPGAQPIVVLPGQGDAIGVPVQALALGRDRIRVTDARTAIPGWQRTEPALSDPIAVEAPALRLTSWTSPSPTARQENTSWAIELPFWIPVDSTLVVRLTSSDPRVILPDSVVVLGGDSYAEFTLSGAPAGLSATLVATAPGFATDSLRVTFVRGVLASYPVPTLVEGDSVQVTLRTTHGVETWLDQLVPEALDVTLQLPAGLAASDGTARTTTVRIPAGEGTVTFWVVATATGRFTLDASAPDHWTTSLPVEVVARPAAVRAAAR